MQIKQALNRRMVICAATGFASGLPLFFLLQLVQAWFRKEGVSLTDIGLLTLVQLPYTLKVLWAPVVETYWPPFLGRRRGWMFITQVGLIVGMASLGLWQPATSLPMIATVCVMLAVFSATQDIVIDAYRRELLPTEAELGLGNSIHVQVYRIAGLVPGSLGFILAGYLPWSQVFLVMAGFMTLGLVTTLCISEAVANPKRPATFMDAVIMPFRDFLQRNGTRRAGLILAFIFLYKLGDTMATALSTSFYVDLGFHLQQIGIVAKNAALWPAIVGGILGGLAIVKIGINRGLWLFGFVQLATILGFVWLSQSGANVTILAIVIAAEYLGVGLGTAAYVAFIARETSVQFAATQFALLTAVTAIPRTVTGAGSGWMVDVMGWTPFFYLCAALAIPGMLLLIWVAPFNAPIDSQINPQTDSEVTAPNDRRDSPATQ